MKKPFAVHYDSVLKDLFQKDCPALLERFTGGLAIREVLNVEFSGIEQRRVDYAVRLEDGSILHIEFQSYNDNLMAYRMGRYGLYIGERYRCRVRQVVIYIGEPRLRMDSRLDLGEIVVGFQLLDIRELNTEALLKSGRPGDYVLAVLSRDGGAHLRSILKRANALRGRARDRVLVQIGALSGLRRLSKRFKMECKAMGIVVDIEENEFLKDIWESGIKKGKREGNAEGRLQLVRQQLETRFGPLPKWARERLAKPTTAQINRWARKILTAETLEGVIGRK